MLHAIQALQPGVDQGRQLGLQGWAADAKLVERPAHHGIGQGAAHRLFHAAVGVAGQVFQPIQQSAGGRAAEADLHTAHVESPRRQHQGGQEFAGEISYLRIGIGDGQRVNGQRQAHGIAGALCGAGSHQHFNLARLQRGDLPAHHAHFAGLQRNRQRVGLGNAERIAAAQLHS